MDRQCRKERTTVTPELYRKWFLTVTD